MSKWQWTYLHSHRMVGNCSHSGFRACSYSFCSVWEGSAWRKSNERELESIISFLSYSSVLCNICGWGNLEATAVSIPFRVPWIFSLFFAFVTVVEGQAGTTQGLRGFAKQAEKGSWHSHQQVVIITCVPKSPNDCSGTSDLPQANGMECLSSFDLMEGWDWGRGWMSKEGAGSDVCQDIIR